MRCNITIALALIVLVIGSVASAAGIEDFSTDPFAAPARWSYDANTAYPQEAPLWDATDQDVDVAGQVAGWLTSAQTVDVTGGSIDQAGYVKADFLFRDLGGASMTLYAFAQDNRARTGVDMGYKLSSYARPAYNRNDIFPDSRLTRLEGDAYLPLATTETVYTLELLMWQTTEGANGTSYVKLNYYDAGGSLLDYALFKDDSATRLTDHQNINWYGYAGNSGAAHRYNKPMDVDNIEWGMIPEPATLGLLGLGGLALLRRRSR